MAEHRWIYRLADGVFLRGGFCDLSFDPAIEGVVRFDDADPAPHVRTERADGAGGTRPATGPEIAAFDAAQADTQVTARIDQDRILKALVIWLAQRFGIPPAQARQELLAIVRSLP